MIGLIAALAAPAVARAGTPPQPLLPDLIQFPPSDIKVEADSANPGQFHLGFSSTVGNVGDGPFQVHGAGPGFADMTAYQVLRMSDGSWSPDTLYEIGQVHYEDQLPNHDHWHFEPFDDYELHRAFDGAKVGEDRKEGFCLVDGARVPAGIPVSGVVPATRQYSTSDFCRQGHPEDTEITEGISVGWQDQYAPFRGGQFVDITGVPAGRYYLVHRVNTDASIQELDDNYGNDVATATVDLSWPGGPAALPAVRVLRTCMGSDTCPYTDPPAPPPPPPPAPDTNAPKLLLGGATRQRFLRGREIYVYAKCDEACTVTASGRIAALQVAKALRTASTRLALKPGVRTKIKLKISARTRKVIERQLARGARVTVRVTLVARDAAGNRTEMKRTLTLLRRPR